MSLLGSQVFANPGTACWVSSTGDVITGDLDVTGDLTVGGEVVSAQGAGVISKNSLTAAEGVIVEDAAGAAQLRLAVANVGESFIQSNNVLKFGQIGISDANTSFQTSAFGAFADLLTVGGTIASTGIILGPSITPTIVQYPGTTSVAYGGGPQTLVPFVPYPVLAGEEYDIQLTGVWAISPGAVPGTMDKFSVLVRTGTGVSPAFYEFQAENIQYPANPEDVWAGGSFHPFSIRARLGSNLPGGDMDVVVEASGLTGAYFGIDVAIQNCDVTRVR